MNNYPIINKKDVRKNNQIKSAYKLSKKRYRKGSRKILKNFLGKFLNICSDELVRNEVNRVSKYLNENSMTKQDFLSKIEASKLPGMSGSSVLILDKIKSILNSNNKDRILIVNAVECEPSLMHDEWILENRLDEVIQGTKYIKKALNISRCILASKKDFIKIQDNVEFKAVPARYPMGEEHFLIKELLNTTISKQKYPSDYGILVLNVQTVYQIFKIINDSYDGGRFVTLGNMSTGEGRISYVTEKDEIKDILNEAFNIDNNHICFAGSGLMGAHVISENEKFLKITNFASTDLQIQYIDNDNKCKNCKSCTHKCPMGVQVHKVVQAIDNNADVDLSDYGIDKCMHCGTCTFYCRASKNVAQYMIKAGNLI